MDSYEEYLDSRKEGSKPSSRILKGLLAKLEFIHIVLLVALILIVNSLIKKGGNNTLVYIIIGVVILIWILSLFGKGEEKKPIPRHIAEKIALNDMQRLIDKDSSYPHGTKAIHTGKFKVHHMDSGDPRGWSLDKYHFGFKILRPGKSTLYMTYQMNPYPPGDCQGIIETQTEWEGTDIKDYQIIIPEKTIVEEKRSTT